MDIATHKRKFEEVVLKYHFNEKDKAEEIAKFLTRNLHDRVSPDEFAILFAMQKEDADIFLTFIEKGLEYHERGVV